MNDYPKREPVAIDGFLIDASVSEGHDYPSEVTKFPVEKGIGVTDNIRPEPIVVTLECIVSDSPLGRIALSREADSSLVAEAGFDADPPSTRAYNHLLRIRARREPVLIQTSLRDFPSMALSGLSIPRKSGEGDALHFNTTFTQIEVVELARRTVQAAQAHKSLGNRSPGVRFIQTTIWRQGSPPGSDHIIINRPILFGQKPNGKWAYFLGNDIAVARLNGSVTPVRELTPDEYNSFNKDFERDHWVADREGAMYHTWAGRTTDKALLPPQDPTTRGAQNFIPYPAKSRFK